MPQTTAPRLEIAHRLNNDRENTASVAPSRNDVHPRHFGHSGVPFNTTSLPRSAATNRATGRCFEQATTTSTQNRADGPHPKPGWSGTRKSARHDASSARALASPQPEDSRYPIHGRVPGTWSRYRASYPKARSLLGCLLRKPKRLIDRSPNTRWRPPPRRETARGSRRGGTE